MKRNPLNMTIGALLIVIFGLLLFLFQVRTSEVAVVTTFGRPTRPITDPGLYGKWPWPIQKVHKLDKRIQNFESKFEETLTPDGYNLLVMVFAGWRISEPTLFFPKFAGGSVTEAERTLDAIIRSAKNEVIGQHPFNHFISVNEKDLKFTEVENEILKKVQQQLAANNYGITVEFLGIKKLGLPESVTQNVFERMQSERQVRVSEIEAQGTVAATTTRAKADSDAAKLISDAEAEAVRIRGEGEAAAAKSFEVFKQEPELANFLIQLTGLEIFLRERTTLILDPNTSPLNLLKPVPQQTNAPTGPTGSR